jgi:hypothetical protein
MTRTSAQCVQTSESHAQKILSAFLSWSRLGLARRRTRSLLAEGKVLQSQVLAGANQRAQGSEDGEEHGEHGGILPWIPRPIAADRMPTSVPDGILARHRTPTGPTLTARAGPSDIFFLTPRACRISVCALHTSRHNVSTLRSGETSRTVATRRRLSGRFAGRR